MTRPSCEQLSGRLLKLVWAVRPLWRSTQAGTPLPRSGRRRAESSAAGFYFNIRKHCGNNNISVTVLLVSTYDLSFINLLHYSAVPHIWIIWF